MPRIRVTWFEGRTDSQRKELAKILTDAMVRIGQASPESVEVEFVELRRDRVAKAGTLWSEKAQTKNKTRRYKNYYHQEKSP